MYIHGCYNIIERYVLSYMSVGNSSGINIGSKHYTYNLTMSFIPDVLGRMLFSAKSFKQVSTSYIHEQFLQVVGHCFTSRTSGTAWLRKQESNHNKNRKSTCDYAMYIHCVQFVPVSSGVTDPWIAQCWRVE